MHSSDPIHGSALPVAIPSS